MRDTDELQEESTLDVLVQGRTSVDLTFLGLPHLPRLGEEYLATGFAMNPGACFINVASLSRLGLWVGFATDLGNDLFSRYVLDEMHRWGIDQRFVRLHDRDMTALSVGLSFPHDRSFITWEQPDGVDSRGILLEDLRRHRVRCLFTHTAVRPDVYAEARRQGIPICVDSFWDPGFLRSGAVQTAIGQAEVFMPNRLEAQAITGTSTPEAALAALAAKAPMVAIKLGADGAIGAYQGRVYRVPALPVEAVDTTGAGDNFDGGFIYGLLKGLPFGECLRCAVVAGSLSTRCPGGVTGSPTEGELLAGLDRLPAPTITAHLFES
jgi:sugar/nucleoside kinase (ribokinase family)